MTTHTPEKVLPYNEQENKSSQIRRMFNTIAARYDQLNHTLSFNRDKHWRHKGVAYLQPFAPKSILDIATGTGDMSIDMAGNMPDAAIIGADISEGMMRIAREKTVAAHLDHAIRYEYQDCLSLNYPDNRFDAVTSAFGVRNFSNIQKGLDEMYRVMKPGGHLMILELSTPEQPVMHAMYNLYSRILIPKLGQWLTGETEAYHYLPASIRVVPQGDTMCGMLSQAGFRNARYRCFTFGVCSMYTGEKQIQ